ncbi:MAG TPA: DUF935 family protein [Vampirovibrionales bacterium]
MLSANIRREITSAAQDAQYRIFGGIPEHEDALDWLLGDRITRYQELLLDADISAFFQKRTHGIIAKEWQVNAASKKEIDQRAARFVRWMLDKKLLFDVVCLNLLDAIILGYKISEILWEEGVWEDEEDGKTHKVIFAKDVRARPSDRFTFWQMDKPTANASLWGYELRFLTMKNPIYGDPLPHKKFVIHSVGSKTSNPLGVGLGSKLYWPHEFKKQGVISSLTFGSKFAQPTIVGKYSPEQNPRKLEEFLRKITEGTSGTLPDGMEVFLLEANRSSSQNFYAWLLQWCEDQLKKVILSETFGNAPQGLSGQPAANDETVREEILKVDADLLHATLNDTLIRWAVEYTFPKAEPPTVWRVFQTAEDLNTRANRDQTLQAMGFRLTFEAFEKIYGEGYKDTEEGEVPLDEQVAGIMGEGEDPDAVPPVGVGGEEVEIPGDDIELPAPEVASVPVEAAEFAQPEEDQLSKIVDRTASASQSQIYDWLEEVRGLMETVAKSDRPDAEKFARFQEGLLGVQELTGSKMAEAIAQASLVSDMGGRFEVLEEDENGDS